jgi:probable HAF family extracellular repeat protein
MWTAAVLVFAIVGHVHADWTFEWLGNLPEDEGAHAVALAADGSAVVGSSYEGSYETDYQPEAFRWTPAGGMVGLGFLPGDAWSEAFGVSEDGSVVIGYSQASVGQHLIGGEAFRWTPSSGMQGLGYLPGHTHSQALGVSADGQVIVGYSQAGETSPRRAFAWTEPGGMVDLGLLPGGEWAEAHAASADGSVIAGDWGTPTSGHRGFVWSQLGGFVDLGEDVFSASDVSDDGSVVVGGRFIHIDSVIGAEAYLWTARDGVLGLGNLSTPNDQGEALAVSGDGSIVVGYGESLQPLLWDAEHGTRNLRLVLLAEGIDLGDDLLSAAQDVSFDGHTLRIVGGDWLASYVVPEPASLPVAMTAFVAWLAWVIGRRRSR